MNRRMALALTLSAALSLSGGAGAADYPARPIRLVVGAASGGGSDFVARAISPKLSELLGQPIVVDNRGGAAGLVASDIVAKSAPDGYTLLLMFANFATFPSLTKQLGFDPEKDLVPVSDIASSPLVLTVSLALPAKSVEELVAAAKGGALNYASPGPGSMGHLAAELFQSMAGVKMTHIPYKGGGPAITGLLGGQVDLYFSTPAAAVGQMRAGKLRALAVTGSQRSDFAPELPTISASGLPGYEVSGWWGVFAPAGTPQPIIDAVSAAIAKSVSDPAIRAMFAKDGDTPVGNSPAEFAKEVQTDIAKWRKVIKEAKIQMD